MALRIFFLAHSGFAVELERCVLVFDFYKDPAGVMERIWETGKPVYFLVSHAHGDHFNPGIFRWRGRAAGYILHRGCEAAGEKVRLAEVGEDFETPHFSGHMYGSTDIGGSFLVRAEGKTIFHAGDLNWWHWAGEADRDNEAARLWYFRELSRVREKEMDIVFFPVDARQEVAREWGADEFLRRVSVRERFIPMHANGPRWLPSYAFRWKHGTTPLWIPNREGAETEINSEFRIKN